MPAESRTSRPTRRAKGPETKQPYASPGAGQLQAAPQHNHLQIGSVMGASGRVGRSRGTFGSEHRWYQPTQASDREAALTHQALAAAAAQQELETASWLLSPSPAGRSKSAQRCTFGSELRWWERAEPHRSPSPAEALTQQAASASPNCANADRVSPESRALQASQAASTGHGTQAAFTLDSEVQWWENSAAGRSVRQGTSDAAAGSVPQSGLAQRMAASSDPSQRSVSVDRGLRQTQPQASAERAWWKPDRDPSPDSTLQRIQQKHARILSLAAGMKQRSTNARTHTAKSTFGSEARWWEKSSAYDDGTASIQSFDQQQDGSSRASSPDRAQKLQHLLQPATAHANHSPFRGQSTFGSEARWRERTRSAESTAAAEQAIVVAPQTSARPLKVPRSQTRQSSSRSQEGGQDEHASVPAYSSGRRYSSILSQPQSESLPQPFASLAAGSQKDSIQRLSARPWSATSQQPGPKQESTSQSRVNTTPLSRSVRASRSSITPIAAPMRQSRGSVSPGGSVTRHSSVRQSCDSVGHASSASGRSRSGSPDVGLRLSKAAKPELQNELRHR